MYYPRALRQELQKASKSLPVVTLLGPRQSGKTTLARKTFSDHAYVSLENPDTRAYAQDDPRGFLAGLEGGAILDEFQNLPMLLSYLQGIVDEHPVPGRFILTGSQNFLMMESLSQSLAGRTAILTLLPLSLEELQAKSSMPDTNSLITNGFYPRIHEHPVDAYGILRDYVQTYVERDVQRLLKVHDLLTFETFLRLCAGRVGQLLNLHSLANDAGISATTAKQWISILEASYILYRLPPWHANINKRLIKTPKLYFHDVALAAYLCGIEHPGHLQSHPLRGAFYENMVVSECMKKRLNSARDPRLYFFRDRTGHEIDLLYPAGHSVIPIEIKSGETIHTSWMKTYNVFRKLYPAPLPGGLLVYGGTELQHRSTATVCGLGSMNQVLDQLLDES